MITNTTRNCFRKISLALTLSGALFLLPSFANGQSSPSEINTRVIADTLKNGRVKFYIACATTTSYTNGGYIIEYKKTVDGNTYTISFTDIKAPNKGTRNEDVARQSIALGKLKHGTYSFEFIDMRGGQEYRWKRTLVINENGVQWLTPSGTIK